MTPESDPTSMIKAKIKKINAKKKALPAHHVNATFRYLSSDPTIAKVSAKGKITAVAKGKCKIYVVSIDGVKKAVSVTVK